MRCRQYTKRHLTGGFFPGLSVTYWLILVNIVLFFVGLVLLAQNQNFINYIALKPSNILSGKYLWTLLTSMFMHGGFFHLFINMFVLFSLGSFMERVIGRKRFFWFYILSGLVAGLVFVFLSGLFGGGETGRAIFGGVDGFAVGASGAIFAVAGLFVILLPKMRFSIIFFPFFSLPGYIMIPLVLFLTWLVSSSVAILGGSEVVVGNSAHFGGFLAGLIYGLYLKRKYRKKVAMLNSMIR